MQLSMPSTAMTANSIAAPEPFTLPNIFTKILPAFCMAINGSNTVAGLKTAIEHLVYAYLLWDRTRLTRYTSVLKNDEHSTEPNSADLYQICKAHYEMGITFVLEVCEFLHLIPNQTSNHLIFSELMLGL